jgi:hypothetical protein
MSSRNPSLSPAFDEDRDFTLCVTARLRELCRTPAQHARFLNMLSLMEHIGSRKIMASQSGPALSHETLQHLAEEARHAFFFKRAAEKTAGRALDYAGVDTMAAASACAYMGRLDAAIAAEIGKAGALPYLYMSFAVELRAIWFYRLYQTVLAEMQSSPSLKSVLAEEELHLEAMADQIAAIDRKSGERIARFRGIERDRFRTLWRSIEAELSLAQAA